ncbi:paraquat-inducible protein A [Massilia sp. 9096]|uniref:paraquat-inducible protein A n=1 Tax=Massilia sp. 9096 TaxID=1500894 RepID=UPI00055E09E3|nr:paraquat-inducible protein A [Massilia sp. 9096]
MSARDPVDPVPRAHHLGVVACHDCGLVCGADPARHAHVHADPASHPHCPRCGAGLHRRRPDSIARTWAFLVAALIMYIPANLYPVMNTTLLGSGAESTILNGVIEFWKSGSYGIALVIFVASVAVPCTKFLVLAILLVMAQRRSPRAVRERAKLYRMIEFIGYWSMLDVMVVGVTSAAIKFGAIGDAEPRIGILFFGLVVILTMLAAMNFDPRLNWDGQEQ